jgi:hypothetical protein
MKNGNGENGAGQMRNTTAPAANGRSGGRSQGCGAILNPDGDIEGAGVACTQVVDPKASAEIVVCELGASPVTIRESQGGWVAGGSFDGVCR